MKRKFQGAASGVAGVVATLVQTGALAPGVGTLILGGTSILSAVLPGLLHRGGKPAPASTVANLAQFASLLAAVGGVADQLLGSGLVAPEHAVWLLVVTNTISAVLPQLRGAIAPAGAGGDTGGAGE